jgi:hypothetical protein
VTPDQLLAQLKAADAVDEPIDLPLFWGHKPTRSGAIGTGCLSQWWPATFTVEPGAGVEPALEPFPMSLTCQPQSLRLRAPLRSSRGIPEPTRTGRQTPPRQPSGPRRPPPKSGLLRTLE